MKKMKHIENYLDKGATLIAAIAFVVMVVLISLNVILRYLINTSINWAEEVAYLCFNWTVFMGVAIVYRHQGLITIDLIVDRLRGNVKKAILIVGYTIVSLMNLGLIIWGTEFSVVAWQRKSNILHIPYFFYDISIPLAAVLLLIYSSTFLVQTIRNEELENTALEDRV